MNKSPLIILVSLAVLIGGFFVWNHMMLNQLEGELEKATASVENYKPEGTQGEAYDKLQDLQKQYPEFFRGDGFEPADFSTRTDLEASANQFKNEIESKRIEIREDVANNYTLTIGSRPNINALIEKTDDKFVKDIKNFAAFNPERVEFYEKSLEYCKTLPAGGNEFLLKQEVSAEEKYQLAMVLENAKTNLCPKL